MERYIYKLNDGRVWDTQAAAYIDEPLAPGEICDQNVAFQTLWANGAPAGEDELIKNLRLYNFDLGELTEKCGDAIREKLQALDAEYLTPRVLAGIATSDAYALEQWASHEALARPWREKLAALEGDGLSEGGDEMEAE